MRLFVQHPHTRTHTRTRTRNHTRRLANLPTAPAAAGVALQHAAPAAHRRAAAAAGRPVPVQPPVGPAGASPARRHAALLAGCICLHAALPCWLEALPPAAAALHELLCWAGRRPGCAIRHFVSLLADPCVPWRVPACVCVCRLYAVAGAASGWLLLHSGLLCRQPVRHAAGWWSGCGLHACGWGDRPGRSKRMELHRQQVAPDLLDKGGPWAADLLDKGGPWAALIGGSSHSASHRQRR